jgi:Calcineurin-like phosphoesterase
MEPDADFDMPEPAKLLVAGDWHGDSWAIQALKHARLAGCDTVLHAGDFGFWPRALPPGKEGFYKGVRDYLIQSNMRLFWVDGNHENHDLLNPGFGDEHIRHLPRGHRWQWWGKTWMAIGGGVSVDKKWRRPHISWFPEETLTPRQFEYCLRPGDVDIIIAHDAPEGSKIPGIHAKEKMGEVESEFPLEAIADSWEHRGLLAEIAKDKQPDYWFHGHYHCRYNDEVDYNGHTTKVVGLDMNRSHLNLNTVILTAKDLP